VGGSHKVININIKKWVLSRFLKRVIIICYA
jgi:hypothetical protein